MWYHWVLFIFVAFVAKVLLAFAMIYILLPNERSCAQCDGETLLIRGNRLSRIGSALTLGRVQWRWCPRCEWEGLARRIGPQKHPPLEVRQRKPKTTPWM
jgi:hypothetical protein